MQTVPNWIPNSNFDSASLPREGDGGAHLVEEWSMELPENMAKRRDNTEKKLFWKEVTEDSHQFLVQQLPHHVQQVRVRHPGGRAGEACQAGIPEQPFDALVLAAALRHPGGAPHCRQARRAPQPPDCFADCLADVPYLALRICLIAPRLRSHWCGCARGEAPDWRRKAFRELASNTPYRHWSADGILQDWKCQ